MLFVILLKYSKILVIQNIEMNSVERLETLVNRIYGSSEMFQRMQNYVDHFMEDPRMTMP